MVPASGMHSKIAGTGILNCGEPMREGCRRMNGKDLLKIKQVGTVTVLL